jgi:hypothetical protein
MIEPSGVFVLSSEDPAPPKDHLAGIVYTRDSVIFAQAGLESYLKTRGRLDIDSHLDGRFTLVATAGAETLVATDPLGQDTLFYYREDEYWAISNSFWALCEVVQHSGYSLDLYLPPLLAPFIQHSLGDQLVSENTPVAQMKVLPLGHYSVIDWNSRSLTHKQLPSAIVHAPAQGCYADILSDYARVWIGRFRCLSEKLTGSMSADISGGRDSRVVLALILASGVSTEGISFQSNPRMEQDYAIAQQIAATCHFEIRNRAPSRALVDTDTAYRLWRFGNFGIYLPVYLPAYSLPPVSVHLHGAGGEVLRQFYSASAGQIVKVVRRYFEQSDLHEMVKREIEVSLGASGVDLEHPLSMNHHYLHFRSRFHFGRNWYRSLSNPLVTPLVSAELIAASNLLPTDRRCEGQLLCDLLLLLQPQLAYLPFDRSSKSYSKETLSGSPFRHSRPDLDRAVPEFTYFGPNDIEQEMPAKYEQPVTSRAVAEKILHDMHASESAAESLGIFPQSYFDAAVRELVEGNRLTKDAKKAVHILTAGAVARLVR